MRYRCAPKGEPYLYHLFRPRFLFNSTLRVHELTNHILLTTDNEYGQTPISHAEYFAELEQTYRKNGIVVPLYVIRFPSSIRPCSVSGRLTHLPAVHHYRLFGLLNSPLGLYMQC